MQKPSSQGHGHYLCQLLGNFIFAMLTLDSNDDIDLIKNSIDTLSKVDSLLNFFDNNRAIMIIFSEALYLIEIIDNILYAYSYLYECACVQQHDSCSQTIVHTPRTDRAFPPWGC